MVRECILKNSGNVLEKEPPENRLNMRRNFKYYLRGAALCHLLNNEQVYGCNLVVKRRSVRYMLQMFHYRLQLLSQQASKVRNIRLCKTWERYFNKCGGQVTWLHSCEVQVWSWSWWYLYTMYWLFGRWETIFAEMVWNKEFLNFKMLFKRARCRSCCCTIYWKIRSMRDCYI